MTKNDDIFHPMGMDFSYSVSAVGCRKHIRSKKSLVTKKLFDLVSRKKKSILRS